MIYLSRFILQFLLFVICESLVTFVHDVVSSKSWNTYPMYLMLAFTWAAGVVVGTYIIEKRPHLSKTGEFNPSGSLDQ